MDATLLVPPLCSLSLHSAGIIKNGGEKPDIIPAYTELSFYMRTMMDEELSDLRAAAEACFRAARWAHLSKLLSQMTFYAVLFNIFLCWHGAVLLVHNSPLSLGYFSPTCGPAGGELSSCYPARTALHILYVQRRKSCLSVWIKACMCFLQVHISYPSPAYCTILPNANLGKLYEDNAKALGIHFSEPTGKFSGERTRLHLFFCCCCCSQNHQRRVITKVL